MNTICPAELRDAIARRCAAVRDDHLAPYASLLRSSAADVVRSVFPLFTTRRGAAVLAHDVDDFVRHGVALEAQFTHLPTEFLRYMSNRLDDPVARTLLEYEWTQFAVEIDEAHVLAAKTGVGILVNPTLRVVGLPFALGQKLEALILDEGVPPFVYAVYRTAAHLVVTRLLNGIDIHMLQRLTNGYDCSSDVGAADWTDAAIESGLIVPYTPT